MQNRYITAFFIAIVSSIAGLGLNDKILKSKYYVQYRASASGSKESPDYSGLLNIDSDSFDFHSSDSELSELLLTRKNYVSTDAKFCNSLVTTSIVVRQSVLTLAKA